MPNQMPSRTSEGNDDKIPELRRRCAGHSVSDRRRLTTGALTARYRGSADLTRVPGRLAGLGLPYRAGRSYGVISSWFQTLVTPGAA
jgi:hypothetical protein